MSLIFLTKIPTYLSLSLTSSDLKNSTTKTSKIAQIQTKMGISNTLYPTMTTLPTFSHTTSSSNPQSLPFPVTLTSKPFINNHSQLSLSSISLSRRIFLPSVSGIWDALTGGSNYNPREAALAIRRGMQLFRQVCCIYRSTHSCPTLKKNIHSYIIHLFS